MSDILAEQAKLAAKRVAPEVVAEMGIEVVGLILTQVFAFLASCKNRENPNPAEVQAAVREEQEADPKRLLRRTARRIRGTADSPMTRKQSFALARASIEQALQMTEETAAACCSAVPNDLVLGEGD